MKKILLFFIAAITLINVKAQQDANKSAGPLFRVSKVEILCCSNSYNSSTKKIHVVSDAGWSVYAITGLTVTDALGTPIATYTNINGDFTSPCISLTGGQTYTVTFVDGAGNPRLSNNAVPHAYNLVAPKCGKTEFIDNHKLDSIKTGNWSELLPANCVPQKSLNISTGLNAAGTLIATNTTDPFWGGYAIANLTGVYAPWNVIAGTRILSPTTSNQVVGTQTLKRNFYLCSNTTVTFSGKYRDDNKIISLKIKDAGAIQKWAQSGLPTFNPQAYNDYSFSGSVTLAAGNYYFEFSYNSGDSYAGFALSGTITASTPVLSNYPNCCPVCECGKWGGFTFEFADHKTDRKEELITDKKPRVIGCGQTLVVKKGTSVKLNPNFTCSKECTTTYKAYMFLPAGGTQQIAGFPYLFNQTAPGYYTIKVVPYCGDKACEPCIIRVFVTTGCEGDVLPTDAKDVEFINTVLAGEGRG